MRLANTFRSQPGCGYQMHRPQTYRSPSKCNDHEGLGDRFHLASGRAAAQ
ncbi:MAG: hypothetical protein ACFB8W_22560 [Elainellaceae cyanobacterium]